MIATLALHASTSTLLEVGIPQIRTHVLGLTDLLTNALDEIGYDVKTPRPHRSRAGILSFACPNPDRLVERLKTRDIIVSLREGIVRVAPHFYNSPEEIQRAEEVIRSHSKEGAV
jgi:selenocysteine lyase/cysteine desulfurase